MPPAPTSGGDLQSIARQMMRSHDLEPDFPPAALEQLRAISAPAGAGGAQIRDQRALPWCSIDNDDSRDLDQLSVAQPAQDGNTRILVAVADVDATIAAGTPLDAHASANTTSVYTVAQVFPMLPERLSTDLTCLAENAERRSLVVDMTIAADGQLVAAEIYQAMVVNRAKLAYDSVAAWLDGSAAPPAPVAAVPGMDEQLRTQDRVAQRLKQVRENAGSLGLATLEAQAVRAGAVLLDLRPDEDNRAKQLIEYFMIAANGVVARYLEGKGSSSMRRVLREPERWERIVQLARGLGQSLPAAPDARALCGFLSHQRQAAPAQFADLSLAIVKLLGRGEYVLKRPGETVAGHFGLALSDYAHATAPNRRFPDIITQRLLKAALRAAPSPYSDAQLVSLAAHCTTQEDNAAKVERQVAKSAAAMLLQTRIGEQFTAVVTGASDKGTWVRIAHPLAEGRLAQGFAGLDVGDTLRVRLTRTDVPRGFIDFARVT
ncbi:MAG TPA: RNB domain-containing ribonuclease [Steroidobacteraceae bacterium]|nr:RNB domain-containing ribonuclease [Steroidobacteraceae bacterium]